jgi:hypothetical protein
MLIKTNDSHRCNNSAFSTLEAAAIQGGVAVVLSNKMQEILQETLYCICTYK